jgi:hypothetical protein
MEILYADRESGYWQLVDIDMSKEEIVSECIKQSKGEIDSYNKVRLISNHVIDASAIMFSDGSLWDAILSNWDNQTEEYFNNICEYLDRVKKVK